MLNFVGGRCYDEAHYALVVVVSGLKTEVGVGSHEALKTKGDVKEKVGLITMHRPSNLGH